jgi:hypothetical protein
MCHICSVPEDESFPKNDDLKKELKIILQPDIQSSVSNSDQLILKEASVKIDKIIPNARQDKIIKNDLQETTSSETIPKDYPHHLFQSISKQRAIQTIHSIPMLKQPKHREIDLHGKTARETIETVNLILNDLGNCSFEIGFITGKGLHSKNGLSVLRPLVFGACQLRGFKTFLHPSNEGIVICQSF